MGVRETPPGRPSTTPSNPGTVCSNIVRSAFEPWLILQPLPVADVAEVELLRFFGTVAYAAKLVRAIRSRDAYHAERAMRDHCEHSLRRQWQRAFGVVSS